MSAIIIDPCLIKSTIMMLFRPKKPVAKNCRLEIAYTFSVSVSLNAVNALTLFVACNNIGKQVSSILMTALLR